MKCPQIAGISYYVNIEKTPKQKQKTSYFRRRLLYSRYLFSRLGQLSFAVKKHAGGMFLGKEKEPSICLTLLCSRYLFSRLGQSIVLA
jgi:hypothetical protein